MVCCRLQEFGRMLQMFYVEKEACVSSTWFIKEDFFGVTLGLEKIRQIDFMLIKKHQQCKM